MQSAPSVPAAPNKGGKRGRVRRGEFWTLSGPAKSFLAGTELIAVVVTIATAATERLNSDEMVPFGLLLVLAVGYAEVAARVELVRRYLGIDSSKAWTGYTSVWAFAGVMVLPVGYAALMTAIVYAHVLVLGHRHRNVRPYRTVFTAATMVLATLAAGEVRAIVPDLLNPSGGALAALVVVLALVAFWVVNLGVLVTGMYLARRPPRFASSLPDRAGVLLEYVTLTLGVVTGVFMLVAPSLTPLVLVLIATTHRSSLVADLRVAASSDIKTGLLNAATWRERARQSLSYAARNDRPACVFVLDLDHFKDVNDEFGHLAGDEVLVRVANTLRTGVRDHDVVGRFGGEEFVVFLDAATPQTAAATAERLRARIAEGRSAGVGAVTGSIGVAYASHPQGIDLDEMLGAADSALYAAKGAGRDCIEVVEMACARSTCPPRLTERHAQV